ncbi:fibroblast growth factor 22 [Rhinatrema bivittatum]|uniref:fibroblast growth factor 22 n=1 Tax=Rhinatrema bivittatum TaxID=194408 RepID=UPI0011261A61|nr:fibroblast growth factor 22 [Rhinatrema bivittatum]
MCPWVLTDALRFSVFLAACIIALLSGSGSSTWYCSNLAAQAALSRSISSTLRSRQPSSYQHLEGDIRWRQLYSATNFFLHIHQSGRVEGKRWKDCPNSVLEIRSVNVGVVAIKSVPTGLFLAMDQRGKLYGTELYSPNCKFKERIEENGYNTYASLPWRHRGRPMFISLNGRGRPRRGRKTRRKHLSTHFLPMLLSPPPSLTFHHQKQISGFFLSWEYLYTQI